jgi:hypothetical protein
MTPFFIGYTATWITYCLLCAGLMIREGRRLTLFQRSTLQTLTQPWKLTTGLIATLGLIGIAPYTGDPTWDTGSALIMSLLTYLTAPWSVGILYRALRYPRHTRWPAVCIALGCWLLSASWSYDLYLLLRDGAYPVTWWSNLLASSLLYLPAGLLWNLQWSPQQGATLGFLHPDWPRPPTGPQFIPLLPYAAVVMALVSAMILSFLF